MIKKYRRWGGVLLMTAIFGVASYLLWRELHHYELDEIREAILSVPARRIWLAAALTVLNYTILAGYDLLAVRSIKHPLPLGKVVFASFLGYVSSFNFGALLGGLSVRYRLYASWGLSPVVIGKLLVVLTVTFWIGLFALAGVVFLIEPIKIPDEIPVPFSTLQPIGVFLLFIVAAYLCLCAFGARRIRIRRQPLELPSWRMALCQIGVASADLMVLAGILFVLLPESVEAGYVLFLGIYLFTLVAVIITHVPGGLGLLELLIILLLAPANKESVVASLVVFRLMYYLIPLAIASVMFVGHEVYLVCRSWIDSRVTASSKVPNPK